MKITKGNFLIRVCLLIILMTSLFGILMSTSVLADSFAESQVGFKKGEIGASFGSGDVSIDKTKDVRLVIASAIKVFLGFMGIIFLVLIVYGGILWMTATGKDDQVNKAKSLLVSGIIGLIIVVSSFAVTKLLTGKIYEATTDIPYVP